MNRKVERNLIRAASVWNIVIGGITLVYYSTWLKSNLPEVVGQDRGTALIEQLNLESVYSFVYVYGLLFIAIGIINLFIANRVENGKHCGKIPVWMFVLAIGSYLTVDIVGSTMYMIAGVLSTLKNKAIKKQEVYLQSIA